MLFRYLQMVLFTILVAPAAQAADVAQGKHLVDTHCYECHGTEVYTRPDRRITSLPKLHSQVRRCELSLGLKWFDEDIDNAAGYLNREFYKFK